MHRGEKKCRHTFDRQFWKINRYIHIVLRLLKYFNDVKFYLMNHLIVLYKINY